MVQDLRNIILKAVGRSDGVRLRDIARVTGFSRAYVHRYFQSLQEDGKILLVGKANTARYIAAGSTAAEKARKKILTAHRILANPGTEEDRVLEEIRRSTGVLSDLPVNILKITEYAFTEMLNNAIEHSRSKTIDVLVNRSEQGVRFKIRDWGIGIYRNLKETRGLASELEAIQELIKGKQTTDPDRHSGEGIFFTSKAVDSLVLKGSGKRLVFDNHLHDVFVHDAKRIVGTLVECGISVSSKMILADVFAEYMGNEYKFDRSRVAVRLFEAGGAFVSRSQARRILANLDSFSRIALDFRNVESIGQGFADEVFRIWAPKHSNIKIEVLNAGENVQLMIHHTGFALPTSHRRKKRRTTR